MKIVLKSAVLLGVISTLAGCATSQSFSQNTQNNTGAKHALAGAIKSQLYSSFGYQTDVYVSNAIREAQLAAATPEQLAASKDKMSMCEDVHDEAYVQLMMKQADSSAPDKKTVAQLDRLKQAYKSCVETREKALSLPKFDFDAVFNESKDLGDDLALERVMQKYREYEEQVTEASDMYLADYDNKHTKTDVKNSQLIKAYLLDPTKIRISGVYQPLSGRLTALPTLEYQAKNLNAYLNQPIQLDFKTGVLYLWADNFAPLVGWSLDDNLGTAWKNKWLAIPLNDESMPKGFAKDLLKFIARAQKESYESLDESAFRWVSAQSVLQLPHLSETLSADSQKIIQNTKDIVQKSANEQVRTYAKYVFADTLFKDIIKAYPEFAPDVEREDYKIESGESVIEVVKSSEGSQDKELNDAEESVTFNSKMLVRMLLLYLDRVVAEYQSGLAVGDTEQTELAGENATYQPISHYGLQGGQLNWIHQRSYFGGNTSKGALIVSVINQAPLIIDRFTTFGKATSAFGKLSPVINEPSADNTVNLFDYSKELRQRSENGGFLVGGLLYSLMNGGEEDYEEMEMPSLDMPLDVEPEIEPKTDAVPASEN